jgi:hypothetical protein
MRWDANSEPPARGVDALSPSLDPGTDNARRLRSRSVANLLRMGHCAPTIIQTVLDVSQVDAQWLIKLLAGLPGGIGNSRWRAAPHRERTPERMQGRRP